MEWGRRGKIKQLGNVFALAPGLGGLGLFSGLHTKKEPGTTQWLFGFSLFKI